jgi:fructoselysine-6-P-deglycase FrlB-like protein
MGKNYSEELSAIPSSIAWAMSQDERPLARALAAVSDENLLAIGSGGSFSVAAYAALMHEIEFGRMARPATPLEAITFQGSTLRVAHLYLSAEGRNKDILAAAQSTVSRDADAVALTMTRENPLVSFCDQYGSVQAVPFEMPWKKDGYLATNSLVAMMVLIARAYRGGGLEEVVAKIDSAWFSERRSWYAQSDCVTRLAAGAELIALFGKTGRIGAIDLESKFAEAALGVCQVTDYRQFAHGRHLQLSVRPSQVILAFGSTADQDLADASLRLVPESVSQLRIALPEDPAVGEIVAVLEAMLLVEAVAQRRNIDVGQPQVLQFGRDMYAMDIGGMYPREQPATSIALSRKVPPSGPSAASKSSWANAAQEFCLSLKAARFKAVIFDFDGTCCNTAVRFAGMDARLIEDVNRLLHAGLLVAFASGRGDSLHIDLRAKIEKSLWPQVLVGYYSGSIIARLDEDFTSTTNDSRFILLREWLAEHGLIKTVGAVSIRGGQLGIRATSSASRIKVAAAVRFWIEDNKLPGWRVFCSGHSVDVLNEHIGKCRVVDAVCERTGSTGENDVLKIGDSGQIEGNDFELLADGIGLSVATVSPLMSSCWNLLPEGVSGVTGMKYYLGSLVAAKGAAVFSEGFLAHANSLCLSKAN